MAKEKKTDIIDLIFVTEERKKFLDYSIEIYKITSSIYYDETLPALRNLKELTPYVVGVKKGDALYDIAKNANPSIQFRFYDTYADLILALKNHEVQVFLMDDIPAQYYLHRFDMVYRVKKSQPFTENSLHWAVPKGKEQILTLLNSGLEKISPKEIQNIVLSMIPRAGVDSKLITTVLIIVLILITAVLFLFGLNIYLKKAVQKATGELNRKNEQLSAYSEELKAQSEEIKTMNEELERALNELEKASSSFTRTLDLIDDAFNLHEDGAVFLKKAFKLIFEMFPKAVIGSISLVEEKTCRVIEARGFDKDLINDLEIPSDQLYVPDKPLIVKDIRTLYGQKTNGNVIDIIPESSYAMVLPMEIAAESIGVIVLGTEQGSGGTFTEQDLRMAASLTKIITSFFVIREYISMKERLNREIVLMLVKALEYYDKYTQGHSKRVANLCKKMAVKFGFSESELELAALLHDVGKIYVPQSVLNKEGFLDSEEFELVKEHPIKGYELISSVKGMEKIAKIVLYHHERYDGKGYPMGLKDGDIPLESQIIFVADSFDAMTTARPYRKIPMTVEKAIEEIKKCSGTQFNPDVVKVFISII